MPFIYPFPASRLSSDALLCAVSAWLTTSPADDECEPSDNDFECSSTSVPMVFSNDAWFVECVPALGALLGELLLLHQQQQEAQKCQRAEECRMRLVLRHLLGLSRRIPCRTRDREEMRLFIDTFGSLLRCSAQPTYENTKRIAQKALPVLLNRFEPVSQFLLLSRLFQLLCLRELPLSDQAHEPQLMAWLVDIYRTKCYAKEREPEETATEGEPAEGGGKTPSAATIGEQFRAQLGHFYAQIEHIVFEDPPSSVNFYVSVCLILGSQALHRHRPALLHYMSTTWICRVRDQIRDWRAMEEANQAAQQQQGDDAMTMVLRRQMAQADEQQQRSRLTMLAFQLDEAERRIDDALKVARN